MLIPKIGLRPKLRALEKSTELKQKNSSEIPSQNFEMVFPGQNSKPKFWSAAKIQLELILWLANEKTYYDQNLNSIIKIELWILEG